MSLKSVPQLEKLACELNDCDIPMDAVVHTVSDYRIKDAKRRKWSNDRLAASLGVTSRRTRQIKKSLHEKSGGFMSTGESFEYHLIKMFPDRETLVSAREIHDAFARSRLDTAHIRAIIAHAVSSGLLEKICGKTRRQNGSEQYRWTGKHRINPSAETPEDRHERSKRAQPIVARTDAKKIFELECELTEQGIERMREFFRPERQEALTFQRMTNRDKESEDGATHDANFGVVLMMRPASKCDESSRDALYGVLIDHENPLHLVLPTRAYLNSRAQSMFVKCDVPDIKEQLQTVLAEAEKLGEGERVKVVASFAYAALEEVPQVRRPRKKINGVLALLAMLIGGLGVTADLDAPSSDATWQSRPSAFYAKVEHGKKTEAQPNRYHSRPIPIQLAKVEHGAKSRASKPILDVGTEWRQPAKVEHG